METEVRLFKKNLKIVSGSFKGGVGKTTMAFNLGVFLRRKGLKVGFIDSDKQRSLSKNIERRESNKYEPPFVCIERLGSNTSTIEAYSKDHDVTIVDVAGHDSKEMRAALLTADILISPIRPAQLDVDTLRELEDMIGLAKELNPNLKAFALINHASQKRFKKTEETKALFKDLENLTILDVCVRELAPYTDSSTLGLSAWEMGLVSPRLITKKTAESLEADMSELWSELEKHFELEHTA